MSDAPKGPKKPNAKKKAEEKPITKKRRGTQLTIVEVLVYLADDKKAHAPGREQSTYPLICIKLPVFYYEILSESFKYCLYEESQK
ncbi:MAG: hypothetical protein R2819_01685 [Allomuricauda sp.]